VTVGLLAAKLLQPLLGVLDVRPDMQALLIRSRRGEAPPLAFALLAELLALRVLADLE
jgi:hypothetical protein